MGVRAFPTREDEAKVIAGKQREAWDSYHIGIADLVEDAFTVHSRVFYPGMKPLYGPRVAYDEIGLRSVSFQTIVGHVRDFGESIAGSTDL
jgi:hypothetical protein